MKTLLRKLSWWFFRKRVKVVMTSFYMSDLELEQGRGLGGRGNMDYVKREMVQKLIEELEYTGLIEFTSRRSESLGGVEMKAIIRVI